MANAAVIPKQTVSMIDTRSGSAIEEIE